MSQTNKLTIYLVKQGIEDAHKIIKNPKNPFSIEEIGKFYTEDSYTSAPAWLTKFFGERLKGLKLFKATAKGVLIACIKYEGHNVIFALTFGTGRHMLRMEAIEENFGLKVTLNSVHEKGLKSIEKTSIVGNAKLSKEQMSKSSEAKDFGIDIEQDLIRAITGKSKITGLGKTISGADAFSLSAKINIDNLQESLTLCYRQYLSIEYKTHFDWIEQIQSIKNSLLIKELENIVVTQFNSAQFDKLWMAVPDLMDWHDLEGFYYLPGQQEPLDDLYIISLRDAIGVINSIDQLRNRPVEVYSSSSDEPIDSWNVFKCLYGEVSYKGKEYVLNHGKWYEINNDFVNTVNSFYNTIPISELVLPDYNHADEGDYNTSVANSGNTFMLMDHNEIMHGGGKNKIEFCDLYSKDRQIVHIKHAAASSVLSHLFMQGMNSGEYFTTDADFRRKLNKKLDADWKLQQPGIRINGQDYEIVFAIISKRAGDRPQIPFFSKVGIKNAVRRLQGLHYKVTIKRIHSLKD